MIGINYVYKKLECILNYGESQFGGRGVTKGNWPGQIKPIPVFFLASIVFGGVFASKKQVWNKTLDLSLIQSDLIQYPAHSIMYEYYTSWNFPAQFFAFVLKITGDVFLVQSVSTWIVASSQIFVFALLIFFFNKSISTSVFLSLALNLSPFMPVAENLLLIGKKVGSSYPYVTWDTVHTPGLFGITSILVVVGLLLNNSPKGAGLIAGLALSIHPVFGSLSVALWICIISITVGRHILNYASWFGALLLGLGISVWSLSISRQNKIWSNSSTHFDRDDLLTYLNVWDSHRSPQRNFDFEVIVILLVFATLLFSILKSLPSVPRLVKNTTITIIVITPITGILYAAQILQGRNEDLALVRIMQLGRLTLLPGYLITPFLLGFISLVVKIILFRFIDSRIKKVKTFNTERILVAFYASIILTLTSILWISSGFTNDKFQSDCGNREKQQVITTAETTEFALKVCNWPILLDVTGFDFVPYQPNSVTILKDILQIGYGQSFSNPEMEYRHNGTLRSSAYKEIWETRDDEDWSTVGKALNVNVIIAPASWDINLISRKLTVEYSLFYIPK